MINIDNLGGFNRGRVWLQSSPDIKYSVIEVIKSSIKNVSNEIWDKKEVCLELLVLPREISNYALIGAEYTPNNSGSLEIEINVSKNDDKQLNERISMTSDEVHAGIPKEYTNSILKVTLEKVKELNFPSGRLLFNIGAHGYVGSSQIIFGKATKILLKIMKENISQLTKDEIRNIILSEL